MLGFRPARSAFVPDAYLDRRRPEWQGYERAGLIRFERQPPGEKLSLVYIDRSCVDVLAVLEAR